MLVFQRTTICWEIVCHWFESLKQMPLVWWIVWRFDHFSVKIIGCECEFRKPELFCLLNRAFIVLASNHNYIWAEYGTYAVQSSCFWIYGGKKSKQPELSLHLFSGYCFCDFFALCCASLTIQIFISLSMFFAVNSLKLKSKSVMFTWSCKMSNSCMIKYTLLDLYLLHLG